MGTDPPRIESKMEPVMTKKIELVNDGKDGVWQEVMKMEETSHIF